MHFQQSLQKVIEQNRYRGSFPSVILTPEYYLHFPDLSSSNFLMLDIP